MPFIKDLAQQLGTTAASGILGLGLGNLNDKRQLNQQEKLQNLQIRGQKDMTDYNYQKQLEMWNATNYEAQMEHLRKAGLNPGLIYGMSGGGGTTTGSATGNVTGATAVQGGGGEMGMAMQLTTIAEQKELLRAQARLANVEADKKAGVDTELAGAQKESLTQGIENAKAAAELTKVQTDLANIDKRFKTETYQASVAGLKYTVERGLQELNMLRNEAIISENTWSTKIEMIQNEAIGIILKNQQTEAQISLTGAQIEKIGADIRAQLRMLEQTDRELSQGDEHILINKVRNSLIETGIWVGAASNIAGDILDILKYKKPTYNTTNNYKKDIILKKD